MKKIFYPLKTYALVGNPNCGKTTLFNILTASHQRVGNFPGVTVEKKQGELIKNSGHIIVDLPGIYSLTANSLDEKVAYDYIAKEKPNLIINIVDATNLKRNLFLTTQLCEFGIPQIVAINMIDELKHKGFTLDTKVLEQKFGCKFFLISAKNNVGIKEMIEFMTKEKVLPPKRLVPLTNSAEINALNRYKFINEILPSIYLPFEKKVYNLNYGLLSINNVTSKKDFTLISPIFKDVNNIAVKNINYDNNFSNKFRPQNNKNILQNNKTDNEKVFDNTYINKDERKTFDKNMIISGKSNKSLENKNIENKKDKNNNTNKEQSLTDKIDNILTNRFLAFPIFMVAMAIVFYVSIDGVGKLITEWLNFSLFPKIMSFLKDSLPCSIWLKGLLIDGILNGVLNVVGFVPQIMILFMFIAFFEGSGYMSRVAFIMDRLLNSIGLSGKSFISLILGCGCAVPAVMSTRTISNAIERNATITLAPQMPCSAKLAVISYFASTLFNGSGLFAVLIYFVSIVSVILGGLVLKLFRKKSQQDVFILELPTYRLPTLNNVLQEMWQKGKSFLIKAGTIILSASIVLWFTSNFDANLIMVEPNNSMLAFLGKLLTPLFKPLGFGQWQYTVASLSGIIAKESIVTTLQILNAKNLISPLGIFSFITFNVLCAPCVATIGAIIKEQGILKGYLSLCYQTISAYVMSFIIFNVGSLFI